MTKPVEIFTDGACKGNPGPGGWGAVLRYSGKEKHLYGGEQHTTNNRMELLAAIMALSELKRQCDVVLTTDSEYLRKGITEWLEQWKKREWRTADKKPIKNQDLWLRLDELAQQHHIKWHWVKAHNGHIENELADALANKGIIELSNPSPASGRGKK